MANETSVHHPIFARFFERLSAKAEARGQGEHRRRLLAGLEGRVIEVGAGNGHNFAHYPHSVAEVVAIEPEPYLRARALEAADAAPVSVQVIDGLADGLPASDGSFDAAVASLVLCTVPDQAQALAELHRVIRPGGELRFYEHVVSERSALARLERMADLVWPHLGGGCHLARDTGATIAAAGFAVESQERFGFSPGRPLPAIAHVLGVARRP